MNQECWYPKHCPNCHYFKDGINGDYCDGCKGREHPDLAPTKFLSNIIDEINRMFPEKHVCIRREKKWRKKDLMFY